MPAKTSYHRHHRSRSSIDRVLDLLADLDENQIERLLLEAEAAASSTNVPVARGIDLFERPTSLRAASAPLPTPTPADVPAPAVHAPSTPGAPRRKFLTSLSPRRQSSLRSRPPSTRRPPAGPASPVSPVVVATAAAQPAAKKTPRSYKRISRPTFQLPPQAQGRDLADMLAAFLLESASSPATPRSPLAGARKRAPGRGSAGRKDDDDDDDYYDDDDSDDGRPELDLLEPSPARSSGLCSALRSPMREPGRNISGIFEILDDAGSPSARH
ncbi:hypothetical protein GGR56DRAFT_106017 [Xylariaceae sp. FL0804]|nr:hypothetical protein GGR56DRAFT_106017 [Xylariaceae sp. FL0804]